MPSRTNPGQFYALVQSPQQFKQILMVAGVERYYQIARCFRDEDLRADRQPEFTQLDIEMSFIDREGMYALMEGLCRKIWKDVLGVEIPTAFPRMTFADAMNRFGVDKPDTRFGMELQDFTETFRHSEFKVFESTIAAGGVVKAMKGEGLADVTQGELNSLTEAAKAMGAKGLAFIKVEGGEWKSPIVKFFTDEEKAELTRRLEIGRRGHHLLCGGAMGKGLRHPRTHPSGVRGVPEEAGQAGDPGRPLRFPLGGRLPADVIRRGPEPLCRHPPSLHLTGARGYREAGQRPQGGPRPALRSCPERRRTGRRQHPYPSAGPAEEGI